MSSKEEKDVLDFLDSLPDTGVASKSDKDILDFLDELETTKTDKGSKPKDEDNKKVEVKDEAKDNTKTEVKQEPKKSVVKETNAESKEEIKEPVEHVKDNSQLSVDPLKSISSWWSTAATTATSTLWDTANSLTSQADQAINTLTSTPLEDNIRNAFKELGITGISTEDLTEEQREKLLSLDLTEARKVIDKSLNKGLNLVNNVIEQINSRDEILEIVFVHDINVKLSSSFKTLIKESFEEVMNEQVDGRIEVKVLETSHPSDNEESNWNMFQGKSNDAEKLANANIEAEIKSREEGKDKEGTTTNAKVIAKSKIYISLLAWTVSKDVKKFEEEEELASTHSSNSFNFICSLRDTTHDIKLSGQSQPLPIKWARWCQNDYNEKELEELEQIDPKDWVSKWVLGSVAGVIGTIAQSYIIRRMGY